MREDGTCNDGRRSDSASTAASSADIPRHAEGRIDSYKVRRPDEANCSHASFSAATCGEPGRRPIDSTPRVPSQPIVVMVPARSAVPTNCELLSVVPKAM